MANKNLLTYAAKVSSVELVTYTPIATIPGITGLPVLSATTYCYIAKVDPWANEQDPPMPTQDQKSIKNVFKNIFAVKLITAGDISPVVQRVNWTSGVIYDYYQDNVDMFEKDNNGSNVYNFYVKNRYDQVFKCLWNANGAASTYEPFFEPGSYSTNNIYYGADGYKWKYIYTIDIGTKVKFMDETWMPVPVGYLTPNPLDINPTTGFNYGSGSVDVINVTNPGQNYDPANSIITVTVTGDGANVSANAIVSGGQITDIIVTNPGSNYNYANVTITSANGFGAIAIAPTSPIGGHGFDPVSELGCNHVMFSAEFNGSENGYIPTDIDYHQVGLLINPTTKSLSPAPASAPIYKTTYEFVLAPGFGVYQNDEKIYQLSLIHI